MKSPANPPETVDPYATPHASVDPGPVIPEAARQASYGYRRGYDDFVQSLSSGSTSLSPLSYAPPSGNRAGYDAGWRDASLIEDSRGRNQRRLGDIIASLVGGSLLFGLGVLASGGAIVAVSLGALLVGGCLILRGFAIASIDDDVPTPGGGA